MKKYLSVLSVSAALILSGCKAISLPDLSETEVKETEIIPINPEKTAADEPIEPLEPTPAYSLAESHWIDVSKIRNEATRLNYQVGEGLITKVQAAQYLNRFRIQQVGENPVDDSMYEIYLRSAIDSQRGLISIQQSKLYIQDALRGWQQRWKHMSNKPVNPAFTNFLMEIMDMKPLE